MTPLTTLLVILVPVWLVWAWVCAAGARAELGLGDPMVGLFNSLAKVYVAVVHRLAVEGGEHAPARPDGPLVVVCNHTAGVDPVLVQTFLPFHVRWMMGLDMMLPAFGVFWRWLGIIGVNRTGRDLAGTREALRHLAQGGVVGVFPEGRLERPARHLLEFNAGVGYLVAKSGARVLPIWIRGTPQHPRAWGSLRMRSRSVLRVGPVMSFEGERRPEAIVGAIRAWFDGETGWPPAPSQG